MLFDHHTEGDGILTSPQSIIRIRTEKSDLSCSDLRFKSNTQSNQLFEEVPGGYQVVVPCYYEEGYDLLNVHHHDLELLISTVLDGERGFTPSRLLGGSTPVL